MDKAKANALGKDVIAALKAVADKHGLQVEYRGGVFDSIAGTYRPKIQFLSGDTARVEFERYAHAFNLEPGDFGKTITMGGEAFEVVGILPKGRTMPVLVKRLRDGAQLKTRASAVARALGRTALAAELAGLRL